MNENANVSDFKLHFILSNQNKFFFSPFFFHESNSSSYLSHLRSVIAIDTKAEERMGESESNRERTKKQMCSLIIEKHVVFKSPAIFYFVRAAFLLTAASAHAIDAQRSDAQRELNLEFLKFLIFGIGAVSTNEN